MLALSAIARTSCYRAPMTTVFLERSKWRRDIAIDLGTANTIVIAADAGSIFSEPSICCFKAYDAVPSFVAAGAQAQSYVGKTPKPLKVVRPLQNGVLSEMRAATELLKFATLAVRSRLRRRRAIVGVPADATQAERQALITAARDAGLADPLLLPEPLLAAIGAGLPINEPHGHMVVDCGAGTTEVAVISLGGICLQRSLRGGGEALDKAILEYFQLKHRFLIGEASAENLKIRLSDHFNAGDPPEELAVSGLSLSTGVPQTLVIQPHELRPLWERHCMTIVTLVREALAETEPELSHDIHEDGIVLTGGGAMTGLLASMIAKHTGIKARVADDPLGAVSRGLAYILAGGELAGPLTN